MSYNIVPTSENGYVSDEELQLITDEANDLVGAGTTTPLCVIGGGAIAVSAALPDFCPTGACTTRC